MMGSRLLWAVVIGFLLGVCVRSSYPVGIAYACFVLFVAVMALLAAIAGSKKSGPLIVIAVALASFAGGIMRMDAAVVTGDANLTARLNEHVTILGTVFAEPDVRDAGVRVSVEAHGLIISTAASTSFDKYHQDESLAASSIPIRAGILVEVPPHAQVRYGDEVIASGTLDLPQSFDTGDGRQFDYPDYLAASGIAYTMSFATLRSTGKNSGNILASLAIDAKEKYLAGLDAVLPEPAAGLAGGITVGDKRSIGPDLSADFQKVSLLQIVVLSGYNITVVANFFAAMLAWAPRYFRFGAGIFVVIFFILISGGASSAVRAGIMAVVAMYARHAGRSFDALRALGIAAFLMAVWNPFTLMFDPGFQLSALAMLGLALFTPTLDHYLSWIPKRFALREIVSTTLATQLAVMPLLLYQDGLLSILALPANVLAMLPVPLSMLASFIAAIGGMLFGSYAAPLAFPAYALLSYIIEVAHALASFPLASVSVGAFGAGWMLAAYATLFGGFWYAKRRIQANGSAEAGRKRP
jgi:competence protein ComEC